MADVRVTSRIIPWALAREIKLDRVVLMMATDIDRTSAVLAPKLTRALVKSKRINHKGPAHYSVSYGSNQVHYARRRHFENKLHPGTLRYLERAGYAVKNNPHKYLRGLN